MGGREGVLFLFLWYGDFRQHGWMDGVRDGDGDASVLEVGISYLISERKLSG